MQAPLRVRHRHSPAGLYVPEYTRPLASSFPDSQVGPHSLTRQHHEHLNPIGSLLSALLPSQACLVLACSQWPRCVRQCSATSFDHGSRERVVRNFRLGRSDVLPCFLENPQRYSVSRPCCTRGRRPVRPVLSDLHRQNSTSPHSSRNLAAAHLGAQQYLGTACPTSGRRLLHRLVMAIQKAKFSTRFVPWYSAKTFETSPRAASTESKQLIVVSVQDQGGR